MDTNFKYLIKGYGIETVSEFLEKYKLENPEVEISYREICYNEKKYYGVTQKVKKIIIISSVPFFQLRMSDGYYNISKQVSEIKNEEYKNILDQISLSFQVYKNYLEFFTKQLRELNPGVDIGYSYDEEKKLGKINSSIPLDKLNFPYSNNQLEVLAFVDKDGYLGIMDKENYVKEYISYDCFTYLTYYSEISYEEIEKRKKEQAKLLEEQKKEKLMMDIEETAKISRENRKFEIIRRERAMNDAQKARNSSAIMAGLCILGAATSLYFNGTDINTTLQHLLDSVYSWESLGLYLQNLGPLTTLLAASAGTFVAKYFKNSKKLNQAKNEFIDFNATLEDTQILGGNDNDKSR